MRGIRAFVAIGIAAANATLTLFALVPDVSPDALAWLVTLSCMSLGALLYLKVDNLLFLARTSILGLIGYFPVVVKVVYGPDALFSTWELRTQDMPIVCIMYAATSLALLGNELGLALAAPRTLTRAAPPAREVPLWRTIYFLSIPLVLMSAYFVVRMFGETVFTSGYGSAQQGGTGELPLGNMINIGNVALAAMFVATLRIRLQGKWLVFAACAFVFLIVAMLLRGLRQDVITGLFSLLICGALVHGRAVRLTFWGAAALAAVIVFFEAWGAIRAGMAVTGIEFSALVERFSALTADATVTATAGYAHFGTVSPIATTFSNTVWLVDTNTIDLALGRSYFEFLLRTPPEALYPGRPQDYALLFEKYGLGTGGGFFEVGEAYMNFGLAGTLLVPGVISFLMAKAFYNVLSKQTVLSYFLLFSFVAIFLRGTWYQTFAFYKCFLTAMILLAFFVCVHRLMVNAVAGARSDAAAAAARAYP